MMMWWVAVVTDGIIRGAQPRKLATVHENPDHLRPCASDRLCRDIMNSSIDSRVKDRMPVIDALKALASQLIVLHHLAFYGPLSNAVNTVAPTLIGWFYDYGRMAVQVFLVVAGFLAPRSFALASKAGSAWPLAAIGRRYWRLAMPYLAALALAIACAAIARSWMQHDSIPHAPTLPQLVAHILMVQDILDYDSLSAGVWYVAIDFQLFVLMDVVIWLGQRLGPSCGGSARAIIVLVLLLASASLLYFNRQERWDSWGHYFFGAYALGALAFWASSRERSPLWLVALSVAGIAVLVVDFRLRICVALATALLLGITRRIDSHPRALPKSVAYLGRISYSVFLLHFPVCLLVNAAIHRIAPDDPAAGVMGMLLAWAASNGAGALFYHYVENPIAYGRYRLAARSR